MTIPLFFFFYFCMYSGWYLMCFLSWVKTLTSDIVYAMSFKLGMIISSLRVYQSTQTVNCFFVLNHVDLVYMLWREIIVCLFFSSVLQLNMSHPSICSFKKKKNWIVFKFESLEHLFFKQHTFGKQLHSNTVC